MTLWMGPSVPVRTPRSRRRFDDVGGFGRRRARASPRSRTSSTPRKSPEPRTSPMSGWRSASRFSPAIEVAADAQGALLQPLLLHDVEHGQTGGAGDGVAAEGAEELHAVVERGGDRLAS